MLRHITVIGFDLDDTLWPCQTTIDHAEETLYCWLADQYPRITDRYSRDEMPLVRQKFVRREPIFSVNMTLMRHAFLHFLAAESGYDADAVSTAGYAVFFQARQRVCFYDDVLPGLERLKKRYRLGSISNGNASVEAVGLAHLLEYAVSAADLNLAKPDQSIFYHFADYFEVAPEQVLYVGDHPQCDVMGAMQAGMSAVWMNREHQDWTESAEKPQYQINNLDQLDALLRSD